ncbi:uncharacterized protein PpBr36_09786 [Pyricularia pennisetigena]|uniref:uncharacterized protein n=1 Tax=Pyricularia pennisetigena TaxID=1578925 RepID=UPI00115433EC|nr:uncharacterized protein PpBr36_09786 [Pyricularia pennisetigena]TLS22138.1 hypothetical protein PpBr36_09786 [Pyricularia pennisetigena]
MARSILRQLGVLAIVFLDLGQWSKVAAATTVASAANSVSGPVTKREAPLFEWETVHLSRSRLDALEATNDAALFSSNDKAKRASSSGDCKVFPGDVDYPSQEMWDQLNSLSGGALIKTVPLAAACDPEWPQYDPVECQRIQDTWMDPNLHVSHPTSAIWPLYQGLTCLPTGHRIGNDTCTLGGYASYSVNVSSVEHIQLAMKFARDTNMRLVVKNTGHDFAAKSVGAGALSIWTHNLDDIVFLRNYSYGGYSGPAFKLGAGVMVYQIYEAAEKEGVSVVGGLCWTVGVAGGYTAGGGHSMLTSMYGMGADQVLSMEVVLPNGTFTTASQTQNPELFWALRGGGGGTFGVVTSIIVVAHPKLPVTTMTFTLSTGPELPRDTFWAGIRAFMSHYVEFADAGTMSYFFMRKNLTTGVTSFILQPLWGANHTRAQLEGLVAPWLADLADLNIAVTPNITEFESVLPAWVANFPLDQVGRTDGHGGSRLLPRPNFADEDRLNATVAAVRHAVESGAFMVGYNIKVGGASVAGPNAVNPAYRAAYGFFILGASWDETGDGFWEANARASEVLTTDWVAGLRDLSPGSGTYLSESDINEPDWQFSFWGEHYGRLLTLKRELDPDGLFYVPQGVGSEEWTVTGQREWVPTQNGRLCRV